MEPHNFPGDASPILRCASTRSCAPLLVREPASLLPPVFIHWLNFVIEFLDLIGGASPQAKALCAHINIRLYQFNLKDSYPLPEVLNEVFWRAYQTVVIKQEVIRMPCAWVRSTACRVIYEQARRSKRFDLIDADIPDESQELALEADRAYELTIYKRAVQTLTPEEQWLLDCHYFQGLSWSQVRQELYRSQGVDVSEMALRKRASRIVDKLRNLCSEIPVRDLLESLPE
jgi:DNA-directed RNA polymerase specialized sigma24 family protein